jgi:hypothetical protein
MMNNPTKNVLTFEQFHETIGTFRTIVKSKEAKPTFSETYGTKYKGCMLYMDFAFYALLRGKPLESVTHDTESERFSDLKMSFERLAKSDNPNNISFEGTYILQNLANKFSLDKEHIIMILKNSEFN